jgi:hypothetical protein
METIAGLISAVDMPVIEMGSVGVSTIRDFEAGRRTPMANNLKAIQAELEARGIRFVEENGAYGVLHAEPQGGKA